MSGPVVHIPGEGPTRFASGTTLRDLREGAYPNSHLVEHLDHSKAETRGTYRLRDDMEYDLVVAGTLTYQ